MHIRFEPAQPDDVTFFWWLYQASYQTVIVDQFGGWDEQEQQLAFLRKWQQGGFQRIVAQDRIGGLLWTQEHPTHHEILELQLSPALRNRGLGTAILKREAERAHAAGKPLRLSALLRSPACQLYLRLGFQIISRTDNQYHFELPPAVAPQSGGRPAGQAR